MDRASCRSLRAALLATIVATAFVSAAAEAAPTSVSIPGSLNTEMGCAGDWDPSCVAAHLVYDANDDVWQNSWALPAGNWEYKAALNDSWSVNYGANAQQNGANIPLSLAPAATVKFYYDDKTHWVTDNENSVIAVAPGSFQSELGCAGDWDPSCLRSWLQDPDGNGIYSFFTTSLPAGGYEGKAALNESWVINYGAGGVQNGDNIAFTVPMDNAPVLFSYDPASHILSITTGTIGWANMQWPPTLSYTVGVNPTDPIYGQVWIAGVTSLPGATPDLLAQVGFGTSSDPSLWSDWVGASFNVDAGNHDEFVGRLWPQFGGTYYYAYRYSYLGGNFVYADLDGTGNGFDIAQAGILTVIGPSQAPEPSTIALLGLGLAGLAATRRRRQ